MNTNDEYALTHQQQRFCDEYLVHFNAFKAAINAGYSDNTARKGELLHLPKVQYYLQDAMRKTQSRLQITHDMILAELAKVAFSNMGNYYDEYAVLKPMNQLTNDEKAAISYYQIMDALDDRGQRIGELSKIKLHNKMAALDKIARHLGFYGTVGKGYQVASIKSQDEGSGKLKVESLKREESPKSESPEVLKMEESGKLKVESLKEEAISKTDNERQVVEEESPKSESAQVGNMDENENNENILTLSPLHQCLNDRMTEGWNEESLFIGEFALGIGADTGPSTGSGQAVAKASRWAIGTGRAV